MFENKEVQTAFENFDTIDLKNAVVAEWNMNLPGNIQKLGNYRFRENDTRYSALPDFYDANDAGLFYTGATDSDVTVSLGLQEDATTPLLFKYPRDKEKIYYSLEDCLKPFRPRSGINKLSYFSSNKLPFENVDMYLRPRYYMASRDDEFKYWRSYRIEGDDVKSFDRIISQFGTIESLTQDLLENNWLVTVSGIQSKLQLAVGKEIGFSLSTTQNISALPAESLEITNVEQLVTTTIQPGPLWAATIENISSTNGLRVGDSISAVSGTGTLGTGIERAFIASILDDNTIGVRVLKGTGPIAGTLDGLETVSGTFNSSIVKVEQLDNLGPGKAIFRTDSGIKPLYGTIRNISISEYKLNTEYGISRQGANNINKIDDANPFVVYKNAVPSNRIVIKAQTHVGNINLGPFKTSDGVQISDPFFGDENKVVPQRFKVQFLNKNSQWIDALSFNENSARSDGSPIFSYDGHLSLEYGIRIPDEYKNNFRFIGIESRSAVLPKFATIGTAYIVQTREEQVGNLFIYNGSDYDIFPAEYDWFLEEPSFKQSTRFVRKFTDPEYFVLPGQTARSYRDFVWIKGIRIAVESMSRPDYPFELIEMSPRLLGDITDFVKSFSITKSLSDLSNSALPVGQLLAGVGNLDMFDPEQAFNENNVWNDETSSGSIIAEYAGKNVKFLFYEIINVENNDYYIPIKTMYSDGFSEFKAADGEVSVPLRDFFFYFESLKSPRILLPEVSLSQAIAILLDSVGFSNYVFKRDPNFADPVIPYFFIPPDQSLSETLNQLAVSTQTAMFFDEFNNFVVMTKEYLMNPELRDSSFTLYGDNTLDGKKANILQIASQEKRVYNAGAINYTTRYIQRTGGSILQNRFTDKEYVYNPSLLWEAAGTESVATANTSTQERFALSAVPLNTNLSSQVPTVQNNQIIGNQIDIGENAYWLTRFKGLFYANGEIIRYDAVEYNITGTGNVWLSSNLDYQKYFAKLPFNGKIYPTGLVRIYAEPFYETIDGVTRLKNGQVVAHGRGQFGTPIVEHNSGLSSHWSGPKYTNAYEMDSSLLYNTKLPEDRNIPNTEPGAAGNRVDIANKLQKTSIIRNFLSSKFYSERDLNSLKTTQTGTVQSSALVMTGPDFQSTVNARNFISYVYKPLSSIGYYKHFGTRLRIIGKVEAAGDRSQTIVGGMTYFNINGKDPTQNVSLGGGSAGIALVNPSTNNGYYFELAALTSSDVEKFLDKNEEGESTISIENILFYKVEKKRGASRNEPAIPTRLWGGIGNIIVDDGNFAGQNRVTGEQNPTVYDLAIEYVDISPTARQFYLYINQKLVARVIDEKPISLPGQSVALFVRGTSKTMFENIYALGKNYATNTVFDTNLPIAPIFGDDNNQVNASEALNKYALSGAIQQTYLTSINAKSVPAHRLYFEEFGTILREAAYFNIKYDRAYPALYAKIAPTFKRIKGYTVSGFTADSYGAEFLVFNNTDSILSLDEKTSNYLRIIGITFTQDTTQSLTVDDFLADKSNLASPELSGSSLVSSPFKFVEDYEKIRLSRILYGKNDFTLESPYIQDQETAENIMQWIINKNLEPIRLVGAEIFSTPILQLGDIVSIDYQRDSVDLVSSDGVKYIIYNISYERSVDGPTMQIYLSEVV
jgi:hypothetical protein